VFEFFSTYSYFTFSLIPLAAFCVAIAVLPSQRRPMGWAALIATFTAPYNYFFVPEYWDPVIMGPLKFGPADVIFLVAHGGLGWLGIPAVYGRAGLRVPAFGMKSAKRWIALKVFFLVCWMSLWWMGLKVMDAALIASAALLGVLLYVCWGYWKVVVFGAALFGVGYTVFVAGAFAMDPGFVRAWNPAALSGFQFLGAPAEEIAWGVAFGAVWPLFVAYVFGVERICGSEAAGSSRI